MPSSVVRCALVALLALSSGSLALADVVPAPASSVPAPHAKAARHESTNGKTHAQRAATLSQITVYGALSGDRYKVFSTDSATHSYTPLIDIPQTVQALPIDLLEDQGAHSLEDAMRNAPGVSVQQGEGNRDELIIRGIKTKSAFFVNGVPDRTERFRDLYNVSEIDVLQGPSALLFGRGNAGGVINIITKKPLENKRLEIGAQTGSWDRKRLSLDANAPFGAGAFRVNVMGENSAGYRDHYYLHRYGINPELRLDIDDDTMIELGAQRAYDNRLADRGIPSRNGRPVDVAPSTFFGSSQGNVARTTTNAFHARLEHYFGRFSFRDTFRVARTNKMYRNMYPGSAVAPDGTLTMKGYRHKHDRTGYFNEAEVAWNTRTGPLRHKLITGIDLFHQNDDDFETLAAPISDVPVSDPSVPGVYDIPNRDNQVGGHELGVYAEDQMSVGRWKALVGLRYTHYTVDADLANWPNGSKVKTSVHQINSAWTPRLGLIYKPVTHDSLYASVMRTFTPQGDNVGLSIKHPGAQLSPQTSVNYEIGNKADFLEGKLSFTAAIFQLDLKHVSSKDPDDPTHIVQTGRQRVRGAELSVNGRINDHWSVYAGYARMDAKILDATTKARAGARVALVPDNQFSLWARYTLNSHWGFGGGLLGRSRVYTSFDNDVILPGYVRADAMAYYQNGGYRISLHLKNLFDIDYYPTANGDNQIMPGAPRNVELRFTKTF